MRADARDLSVAYTNGAFFELIRGVGLAAQAISLTRVICQSVDAVNADSETDSQSGNAARHLQMLLLIEAQEVIQKVKENSTNVSDSQATGQHLASNLNELDQWLQGRIWIAEQEDDVQA